MLCPFNGLRACTMDCVAYNKRVNSRYALVETVTELPASIGHVGSAVFALSEAMTTPEVGKALEGLASITYVPDGLQYVAGAMSELGKES